MVVGGLSCKHCLMPLDASSMVVPLGCESFPTVFAVNVVLAFPVKTSVGYAVNA